MSETLENYGEVYTDAVYRAAGTVFTLSPEATGERLFGGRPFVLVTAYNPRSVALGVEENRRRNAALGEALRARGLEFAPSSGASPDGAWEEPGFVVFEVSLSEALDLGRRFEQHAVVWGEGERALLAWCEDGRLEPFYPHVIREEGV